MKEGFLAALVAFASATFGSTVFAEPAERLLLGDRVFQVPNDEVSMDTILNGRVLAVNLFAHAIDGGGWGMFRTVVMDGPQPGVNLDFYYQFSNVGLPSEAVNEIRIPIEPNIGVVNVAQRGDFFFFPQETAVGLGNATRLNSTVFFRQFPGEVRDDTRIHPGEISAVIVVRTYAREFNLGTAEVGSASFSTFQPAIPEPSTNALILAGLGLVAFAARRRKEAPPE
jgi:hypothetical protein